MSDKQQQTSNSNNSGQGTHHNPVTEAIREALELLDEVNFFESYHEGIDRAMRETKPEDVHGREYLYLQHQVLDGILDSLRVNSGQSSN